MPTQPGTPSAALDTKQAAEKFAGLIIESSDEPPETDAATTPAPLVADAPPAPPETTPPAPSATDPDESPDADEAQVFTIPVDGDPVEVTLKELKESFSYKGHNTRTAQDLAEQKKRLEPTIRAQVEGELAAERAKYQQGAQQLIQALEQIQGEPDWVKLRTELQPADYLERKADWEAQRAQLEQFKAHERQVAQEAETAQAKQYAEYRRQEQDKLLAAIPEWANAEVAQAEHQKLVQSAKTYGFAEQDIRSVTDHRILLVLRDAMRYTELKREPTAQVKAKTAGIKTAKPGTPARARPNEKQQQLIERVAKSGRQRDAMAAIESMLD